VTVRTGAAHPLLAIFDRCRPVNKRINSIC
jgi:hypothetical protein